MNSCSLTGNVKHLYSVLGGAYLLDVQNGGGISISAINVFP